MLTPATTFLFTGGGTGGHLFPGIAVAAELRRRDSAVRTIFVGSDRAIESTIVAQYGLEHRILPVEPLPGLKRNPFRFLWRNWQAVRAAALLLRELQPTAVIGLGGFASAPLAWAARRHRIPIILLEQNLIPGRTTRWLSPFATHVCVSFEATGSRLPRARSVVVTGNPVDEKIAALFRESGDDRGEGLSPTSPPELLILGGSQGADSLNEVVVRVVQQLRDVISGWKIIHQTGPRQVDSIRKTYQGLGFDAIIEPFFHEMSSRYATASLVISRAGATSLAELACAGVAMILVPYPQAADDHQRANALEFVEVKAAIMIVHAETPDATAKNLAVALGHLISSVQDRNTMGRAAKQLAHPDAAQRIADLILGAIGDKKN